jgi:ABC-type uncharacterized transport system fused permease/ATPase subunit
MTVWVDEHPTGAGQIDLEPCRLTVVARPVACNTRDVAGPVLLERERELAELAQAAHEAAAGEGGLVLVSGEAGIGKSSLVRALRGLLPAGGACWSATATTWAPRRPWGRSGTWSARSAPS